MERARHTAISLCLGARDVLNKIKLMYLIRRNRSSPDAQGPRQFGPDGTFLGHRLKEDLVGIEGACYLNKNVSLKRVQQDFDTKLKIWQQSTCRRALLYILDKYKPENGWQIEKVICLGTGTFSDTYPLSNKRSMLQFVCGVDIGREIEKRGHGGESKLRIFAQDPGYAQADRELMTGEGVEFLEFDWSRTGLRAAKDHLGMHTLVFDFGIGKGDEEIEDLYKTDVGLLMGHGSYFLRWRAFSYAKDLENDEELRLADEYDGKHGCHIFPDFSEFPDLFHEWYIHWPKRDSRRSEN